MKRTTTLYLNKPQREILADLKLRLKRFGIEPEKEGFLIKAIFLHGLEQILQKPDPEIAKIILEKTHPFNLILDTNNPQLRELAQAILFGSEDHEPEPETPSPDLSTE